MSLKNLGTLTCIRHLENRASVSLFKDSNIKMLRGGNRGIAAAKRNKATKSGTLES